MKSDPLIIAIALAFRAEREALYAELAGTKFESLYDLGRIQGRLQGLDIAQKAIDDADKELNEG